jgi:hypothetical protein
MHKVEQVGMVFQLFRKRNCARFYGKVQEGIEACLGELKAEHRENDEVFQTKEVICAALRRKSRCCCSPEMHRQFIAALSQLVAPKVRNVVLFSVDEDWKLLFMQYFFAILML